MQLNYNISKKEGLNKKSEKLNINDDTFKKKLKNHQKALLYKTLEIDEKYSKSKLPFGIMSDKPGSGKTYVVLSLIYYSKYLGSNGINIIVVPHSIYNQWIESIKNFLGNKLKFKCLTEYNDIIKLFLDSSILTEYDILLTTPLYYDSIATTINSMNLCIRRLFFDEADTMKNLLINSLKSDMTWFVSASINSVFDNQTLTAKIGVYELYLPDLLKNDCYCDIDFIDSNIILPKPNQEVFKCLDFYIDNILTFVLDKENLNYINAHNYLSVMKNECVGYSVKNSQDILRYMYKNTRKLINESETVLKELQKDKTVSNAKKDNLEKKNKNLIKFDNLRSLINKNNLCIECMEHLDNKIFKSECEDYLCEECYNNEKIIIKCNTCNKTHRKDSYIESIINIEASRKKYIIKSLNNKFILLDKILDICDDKIIIFSKYKGLNNYIQNYTINNGIKYEELNGGNIKDLDKILISFKNDNNVKILLIDDAYFGVGLNIEYTTDIIFFHKVDEKIKNQLVGRAQRWGRKGTLNIWILLYANEK